MEMQTKLSPVWAIYIAALLMSFGIPMTTPFLPLLADSFGVDRAEVTYITVFYSMGALVFTPVWGYLSDRVSTWKVYRAGLILFGTGCFLAGFAQSFHQLLMCRIIQGAGVGALMIMAATLPALYYEGIERASVMGRAFGVMCIGMSVLPFLSGFIALFSWRFVFISFAMIPFSALFVLPYITPPVKKVQISVQNYKQIIWKNIKKKEVLFFLAIAPFFMGVDNVIISVVPLYITERFNTSTFELGLIFFIATFGMILGAGILMPRLMKMKLFPKCLPIFILLGTMSIFMLSFVSVKYAISITLFVFYLSSSMIHPLLGFYITTSTDPEALASIVAIQAMLMRAGQTIFPLIWVFIYMKLGAGAMFSSLAGVFFLVTGSFYLVVSSIHKKD